MNRTAVILIGVVVAIILVANLRCGAAYQPTNLGWVNLSIASATVTEIQSSTAPTIGYQKWCYNCAANGGAGTVCYSTGTTATFQFVLSTGTACK